MKNLISIIIIFFLVSFFQISCVKQQGISPDPEAMMANAREPGNNAISSEQNQRMIVVTITDEQHKKITGGVPINTMSTLGQRYPPIAYQRFINDLLKKYGLLTIADWPLASLGVRCFIFEIQSAAERNTIIAKLQLDQRIETAQPMHTFSILGNQYNDPYLKLQHNYNALSVDKSHRWATGKGVTIAVVDTGTDFYHEDLKSQIGVTKNFVDNDNNAFIQDKHGTAISGVIAASTNNAIGMAGIAPDAKIFPMKACWQPRKDSDQAQCSSFTLAKAIDFVISEDVDVINLSLTGPNDPLIKRLLKLALEKHITVVAAVGQDETRSFPANMRGVLAVKQAESRPVLEKQQILQAPGEKILGTTPGDQYDFFTGSSFSAAQVSGLIALIKERKPHLTNEKIYATLKDSAPVFRNPHSQNSSVNACNALSRIINTACK